MVILCNVEEQYVFCVLFSYMFYDKSCLFPATSGDDNVNFGSCTHSTMQFLVYKYETLR